MLKAVQICFQTSVMASPLFSIAVLSLLCLQAVAVNLTNETFNVRPFKIDLSAGVPRMLKLVNDTQLPEKPQYPNIGASEGIDLDVLKGLREEWLDQFDWEEEQTYLNMLVGSFNYLPRKFIRLPGI